MSLVLGDVIELINDAPDAERRFVELAERLKDSPAENNIPRILLAQAKATGDKTEGMARYKALIDTYRASEDESTRHNVLSAATEYVKLVDDTDAAVRLAEELITEYSGYSDDTDRSMSFWLSRLALACADAVRDTDRKVFFLDEIIEREKFSAESSYVFLEALKRKATLLNDPGLIIRHYDDQIAAATDDRMRSNMMLLRLHALDSDDEEATAAAANELIDRFMGSDDPEVADKVLSALRRLTLFTDRKKYDPRYDKIIEKFTSADNAAGMHVLAQALFRKAQSAEDEEEQISLYDRILALSPHYDSYRLAYIKEQTIQAKSRVRNDPSLLTAYYHNLAMDAARPDVKASYLLKQAESEPRRDARNALYREVLEMFGHAVSGESGKLAAEAVLGMAKAAENKSEAEPLYRDALRRYKANRSNTSYEVGRIYDSLAKLLSGREERLLLIEDKIAFYRDRGSQKNNYDLASAIMEKAELMDTTAGKIALLDEAIGLMEKSERQTRTYRLDNALLVKAKLVENKPEKITLYDRVLQNKEAKKNDSLDPLLSQIALSQLS